MLGRLPVSEGHLIRHRCRNPAIRASRLDASKRTRVVATCEGRPPNLHRSKEPAASLAGRLAQVGQDQGRGPERWAANGGGVEVFDNPSLHCRVRWLRAGLAGDGGRGGPRGAGISAKERRRPLSDLALSWWWLFWGRHTQHVACRTSLAADAQGGRCVSILTGTGPRRIVAEPASETRSI